MLVTRKIRKKEIVAPSNVNLEGEEFQKGLAKLVLTVIELLRQILERQAQRRIVSGTLSQDEVERVGLAFIEFKRKVKDLSLKLGVPPDELDVNLATIISSGKLSKMSLVDVLDSLIAKKPIIAGQVKISVADVDLIVVDLLAMISGISQERSVPIKQIGKPT